jgi:hypothetical protein
LSGLANSRIIGKPEVTLGPDLFGGGGQVANAHYIASDHQKLTHQGAAERGTERSALSS